MNISQAIKTLQSYPGDTPCAFALWVPEDVKTVADELGVKITDDDISNVLGSVHDRHDADIGICWDTIKREVAARRE